MALAVAQALDAGAVVELVLEGVETEAAGVGRRTSADAVTRKHLDADPIALTQRGASEIDDILGGAAKRLLEHQDLGELGETLLTRRHHPSRISGVSTTALARSRSLMLRCWERSRRRSKASSGLHPSRAWMMPLAWPITSRDCRASCSCSMTAWAFA